MAKLIFITGGARSGKSRFAVNLAKQLASKVTFVATAIPKDEEMLERIRQHQKDRPAHWRTMEEGKNLSLALSQLDTSCELVLIDCLSFLISNLLLDNTEEENIIKQVKEIAGKALHLTPTFIVVSNEVGYGVVPPTRLGRKFRDICGRANQIMAEQAQEVYLMISGIPMRIKRNL
ncbi:bifunctional adenosylcobinamide kinase/adenosylcobinamide-phosphate guanylyltransferase [Candidatus Aerophobetes bacterium]|uniref:Adenosylcobinamide kinase n=1 Tax=Aerophobetes bacterium TaxID=2030807 RepID=A0A523UR51_UNCAE|nr:MAG: bifunctional adenosylcobinamide kinase/adenosylcobinamide-phosphate guanylyltransferase [Candidatus Aerophobetes bacterium]